METTTTPPASDVKKKPRYPAFSLREALEKIESLYKKGERQWVPVEVAMKFWGYTSKSSSGSRCVATLLSFGLIETSGGGNSRRLRLSDDGHLLLKHPDREGEEYLRVLQAAALAPQIHQAIWDHFGQKGLPPDDILVWELEKEFKLRGHVVKALVSELRDTFSLAKFTEAGILQQEQADQSGSEVGRVEPKLPIQQQPTQQAKNLQIPKIEASTRMQEPTKKEIVDLPLPLKSGGTAVLKYPYPMSKEDFEWLKTILDAVKDGMLAPANVPSSESAEDEAGD
jgi:hypothetical protein